MRLAVCMLLCLVSAGPALSGMLLSPAGDRLLRPDPLKQEFEVCSLQSSACRAYGPTLTGGRMARWYDDHRVLFKVVQETAHGDRLQAPAILDIMTGELKLLHDPVPLAGNPACSHQGHIAFTIGRNVELLDADFQTVATFELPHYVNWIDLAPNASTVAYNDPEDAIWLYSLETGEGRQITPAGLAACRPRFSPDGQALLVSSLSGELIVVNLGDGALQRLGPGDDPVWINSNRILASQRSFESDRLVDIQLVSFDRDGSVHMLETQLWPRQAVVNGNVLYFLSERDSKLYRARFGEVLQNISETHLSSAHDHISLARLESSESRSPVTFEEIRGVPYHHQVYDTPGWFDGSGACGATSATMAVQYYGILPDWDFLATTPFEHTSHFGAYVAEIYSYNGYTYNMLAGGGYGAHGWIWHDLGDGADTKESMRSYISQHGLSSPAVDWSPTWTELQAEVAARTPFVLLSSITTSGHYTTVTGFIVGQHTIRFNDPYGNKNEGYMNYNGAGVSYDWPGYNNGYENLNTVWCYIYARGSTPETPQGSLDDPIDIHSFPYSDSNTTRTSNGTDVFDEYSCAPGVDEQGREISYRFTVPVSGQLDVSVACDHEVDIDLHLLTVADAQSCLTRAHISFSEWIPAGTYWLICDTYHANGIDLMGDYTLSMDFSPDTPLIFKDGFESSDTSEWSSES